MRKEGKKNKNKIVYKILSIIAVFLMIMGINIHHISAAENESYDYKYVDDYEFGDSRKAVIFQLKDESGESLPSIDANCIIEYNGENWILKTNPSQYPQDYYVDDKTDNTLWTWNDEYQCWVDVINGTFREGHWRISQM